MQSIGGGCAAHPLACLRMALMTSLTPRLICFLLAASLASFRACREGGPAEVGQRGRAAAGGWRPGGGGSAGRAPAAIASVDNGSCRGHQAQKAGSSS